MTTQTLAANPEAAIKDVLASWLQAVQASDLPGIIRHYTTDIVAFDAVLALQFKGRQAYQDHWQACISMCSTPMKFEMHELQVTAGNEAGFGHYLTRCGGVNENGQEHMSWMRVTVGLRKVGGDWKIAHEHFSAPFDMASNQALLNLQP